MSTERELEFHGRELHPRAYIERLHGSGRAIHFSEHTNALPITGGKTMHKFIVAVQHPYIPRFTYEVDARSHADAARVAAEQHIAMLGNPTERTDGMMTGDRTYTLSTRQITAALNGGISYLIPWPAHIIGEYGSGTFDGSPVTPEACDRVMAAYVADVLGEQFPGGRMTLAGNPDMVIHSVIAGRQQTRDGLVPCIVVRIGAKCHVTGFGREVWAHE